MVDNKKRNIVVALMVAMFLGAVEGTIVTTAIPTIVKDLKGLDLFSWVFSAYLLTSAISTPISGKLADLFGRKKVICTGILIFTLGSTLCGLSENMQQLICFRSIQGIGAGAVFTVTFTIIGDLFPIEERAKVQGSISSVWGIASLLGPFLGGFLIDSLSWKWIFFINIPFAFLSLWLLQKNLLEKIQTRKIKIDVAGAFFLSLSMLSMMLASIGIGNQRGLPMFSTFSFFLGLMSIIAFLRIEKRARDPVIPFDIFNKTSNLLNMMSCVVAAILMGVSIYLPIYMQQVLGLSPTISGLSMAPMSLSWILFSLVLGKAMGRLGTKIVLLCSALALLLGMGVLLSVYHALTLFWVIFALIVMGFGFSGMLGTTMLVIQSAVSFEKRGVATGTTTLLRTLGQTIGVSVFGILFNTSIYNAFADKGDAGQKPEQLIATMQQASMMPSQLLSKAIYEGIHFEFIVFLGLALICLLFVFLLPKSVNHIINHPHTVGGG